MYQLAIRARYLFVIIICNNSDNNNGVFHSIENANKCRQQDMAKITREYQLIIYDIEIISLFYCTLNDKMSVHSTARICYNISPNQKSIKIIVYIKFVYSVTEAYVFCSKQARLPLFGDHKSPSIKYDSISAYLAVIHNAWLCVFLTEPVEIEDREGIDQEFVRFESERVT